MTERIRFDRHPSIMHLEFGPGGKTLLTLDDERLAKWPPT